MNDVTRPTVGYEDDVFSEKKRCFSRKRGDDEAFQPTCWRDGFLGMFYRYVVFAIEGRRATALLRLFISKFSPVPFFIFIDQIFTRINSK
jgi:hypothetical protein